MNSIRRPSIHLAKTLMTTLDSNKNGQLSTEEFTSFLSKLLSGVQTAASAAAATRLAHADATADDTP